jgi:hypothetical protein
MAMNLQAPPIVSIKDTAEFLRQLYALRAENSITVDARQWRFVRPFNMLLIGGHVNHFRHVHQQTNLQFENFHPSSSGYFRHIRFIDYLNGQHDNMQNMVRNENYISITRVPTQKLIANSAQNNEEIAETIDDYAGVIVDLLFRGREVSIDSKKILRFSIREIVRNVFEHSQAIEFYVTGQYWPSQKRIQVALCDTGVGIKSSISRNRKLEVKSDRDALHLALMPGISGSPDKLHEGNLSEGWRNSGFGLFMTSRFCRKSGGFSFSSGDCCLVLDEHKTVHEIPFAPGTAIRLDLHERDLINADNTLRRLEREGEAIQKEISSIPFLTASRASRMLSVEPLIQEVRDRRAKRLSFSQNEQDEL